MDEPGTHVGTSSPPTEPGFWRRLLFRGMLAGGVGLFLLLAFLIAITAPNLRREVAPPEISGPQRVSPSQSSPEDPNSNTLSVSTSTSGTQSFLNLDDYPHLSPKMRGLAQAWLDQCEATSRALDTIADPALRAQALAYLKDREKMRAFLNQPLKWDGLTFKNTLRKLLYCKYETAYGEAYLPIADYLIEGQPAENFDEQRQFFEKCPGFANAFKMELYGAWALNTRSLFEYSVQNNQWNDAEMVFEMADKMRWSLLLRHDPQNKGTYEAIAWDEQVYCMRQMGGRGVAMLATRSCLHGLTSRVEPQMGNRPENPMESLLFAACFGANALTTFGMDGSWR